MSALPRVLNTPLSQTSMVGSWILRENNRTPGILSRTHKGLVIAPVLTCHILVYVLGRGSRNKATHRNPFFLLSLESSVWMFTCTSPSHKHASTSYPRTKEHTFLLLLLISVRSTIKIYPSISEVLSIRILYSFFFPLECAYFLLDISGVFFKWRLLWLWQKIATFFYFSLIYLTQSFF